MKNRMGDGRDSNQDRPGHFRQPASILLLHLQDHPPHRPLLYTPCWYIKWQTSSNSALAARDSTEPKIVMADSYTSRNVESPLARSVVDLSTTGVDASKPQNLSAALGESNNNSAPSSINNSALSPTTTAIKSVCLASRDNKKNGLTDLDGSAGETVDSTVSFGATGFWVGWWRALVRTDVWRRMGLPGTRDSPTLGATWRDRAAHHLRNSIAKRLPKSPRSSLFP